MIYGIPVGIDYEDFHKRASNSLTQLSTSLTHDQAVNIMWTGLDPNGGTAYSKCLDKEVLSSRGLHAVVQSATANDIAVLLRWMPQGKDPAIIRLSWTGLTTDSAKRPLPTTITQGETVIVVARPSQERTLAVNAPGFASSLTLEPIPSLPPPPKPFVYTLKAAGYDIAKRPQLSGCDCGDTGVSIYANASGPNANTTIINGKVDVPTYFRWEASYICRHQGIKDYPQNLGTIDFGQGTVANLPEIYGVVSATYPLFGDYTVKVKQRATCLDNNCSKACAADGSVVLHIAR